jgi:arginyl-tRNA synthetase
MYIASLYGSMGWEAVRMNYLGDWGKHIGLLAAGWSRFGSEELFEANPLEHLLDVFVKIRELHQAERQDPSLINGHGIEAEKDEFFRKLEDHDLDAIALWKRFRDASVESYVDIYARLNLAFDQYSGESDFSKEIIDKIESLLKEKGAYHESDGAWIIDFAQLNIKGLPNGIARYRNGTTSYLLRDIAAFLERSKKYSFDKMIYVASSRQESHFNQLFRSLELLGETDLDNRLKYLRFGMLQGLEPSPNSSGLLLSDILNKCQSAAQTLLEVDHKSLPGFPQNNPKIADALGITSLIIQDLSHRHNTQITIDVDKIATIDKHNGIALQQWYVALSVKLRGISITREELDNADLSIFAEEEYADVLRVLI